MKKYPLSLKRENRLFKAIVLWTIVVGLAANLTCVKASSFVQEDDLPSGQTISDRTTSIPDKPPFSITTRDSYSNTETYDNSFGYEELGVVSPTNDALLFLFVSACVYGLFFRIKNKPETNK